MLHRLSTHIGPCRLLILMLAIWLSACSEKQENTPPTEQPPAPASTSTPAATPPAAVANASSDDLEEKATNALHDNHMYSPAGNNAIEYYLAIREKNPKAGFVTAALSDLTPYAVLAADQSIQRQDFNESQRLITLVEKIDPKAPALPRLKKSLDDSKHLTQATATTHPDQVAKAKLDDASARVAKQKLQAHEAQAAANLAAFQEARRTAEKAALDKKSGIEKLALAKAKAAAQKISKDKAEVEKTAAEVTAATKAASKPESKATNDNEAADKKPDHPAASGVTPLKPLNTPAPVYPKRAMINRVAGEVTVEYTVNQDGSVSNARVLDSKPGHLFDQAVLSAVSHWHFQPIAEPITTKKTFNFKPD